jgi:hypothetical protein
MARPMGNEKARFWGHVTLPDPVTGCMAWTSHHAAHGYAQFNRKRDGAWKALPAHRESWELTNGHVPDGYEIDHLCRNRSCVRPDHLELVTHTENLRRIPQELRARPQKRSA